MARASGWRILEKLVKLIALIVVAGVLAAGFLLPYVGGTGLLANAAVNKFDETACTLTEEPLQQVTTMYASDGKTKIASFFNQNRVIVPFAQVPKFLVQALVSTEDKRFYSHHGVDLQGLIRAALHTSSGSTQGGSTLTEQYVKQANYYNAITKGDVAAANAAIDQTADRKIADAKCALQLEKEYSKDQILEKYLNIAFFGENAYGIQRAAQTFFGVNVSQVTVPQAALLVGLVRSPTYYDPYQNLQNAKQRRDLILQNMADQKYITQAAATAYKAQPVTLARQAPVARGCYYYNKAITNAGFFCDYALQWLETTGGVSDQLINQGGLSIVTTLNKNLQIKGQAAIAKTALDPKNDYLLAMPSITPKTGAVTTMITDKHYGTVAGNNGYTVNRIFTDAYAGSGSTYKYFTALAALKSGVTPNFALTTNNNTWTTRNCPKQNDGTSYTAHNAGNYQSTLPLSEALPQSSNTYFVAMEDQLFGCDLAPIVSTATSLGMNSLNQTELRNGKVYNGKSIAQNTVAEKRASFTLGQTSTSALELTGAFATLANDGVFCPPTPIVKVTDSTGKAVPFKHLGCQREYSSFIARSLVNVMVNDTHGDGTAGSYFTNWYSGGNSIVAAKTGTNNASDAQGNDNGKNSALWFVGITPDFVASAAIVNPVSPTRTISNVPGVTANNDGSDTFGAFGATFWLDAYGSTVAKNKWTWPTTAELPGNQVPNYIINESPDQAETTLSQAGYKLSIIKDYACGSALPAGQIAYFTPSIAEPGSTITACLSSGVAPYTYVAPPKKTTPASGGRRSTTPTTHR